MPEHHAVLFQGRVLADTAIDVPLLRSKTELEFLSVPVLSIAIVRELIASAYVKPFEKPTKTIVLEVGQIAPEAQQALLKVLEEPPLTTRFILVLPSFDSLLATLRSRLYQPIDERMSVSVEYPLFQEFLRRPFAERMAQIADIAKTKETSDFDLLCDGLRSWAVEAPVNSLTTRIHEWLLVLPKRGSSKKMLWEDIALSLPTVR